jgi:Arc/MetJ-type ribon-helix-helix transcriptional regulator
MEHMGTNLKRTTIFLTEEQHEMLRRLAFEKRTSMAELIREAILRKLQEKENTNIEDNRGEWI